MKLLRASVFFFVGMASYTLFCGEYEKTLEDQKSIECLKALPPNSWLEPKIGAALSTLVTVAAIVPVSTLCAYFGTASLACQIGGSVPAVGFGLGASCGWIATGLGVRECSKYEQLIKDSAALANLIEIAYNYRNKNKTYELLKHIEQYQKNQFNPMSAEEFAERLILMHKAGYFSAKWMFKQDKNNGAPKIKTFIADYKNFGLFADSYIAEVFDAVLGNTLLKEDLKRDAETYQTIIKNYKQAALKSSGDIEGQSF